MRTAASPPASFAAPQAAAAAAAPAPAAAATPPANAYPISFGRNKRKAAEELVPGAAKRSAGRPDKAAFQHCVLVSPVNPDPKNAAPALFKKLLLSAAPFYTLPLVYIERDRDPASIAVRFATANDANGFVGAWHGAKASMPLPLRAITATHMPEAGSSSADNTLAFLTGN
ncbi:hypothetical protein B0H15DRAFT_868817 [Mycena belliarum]|uniref:Uncharacterized protein n=1 Tax=Mycena belliarum TaxID=1033014 RepID=A0AAD6TT82_9AGAR|nr:hypothetical protein B0H15DRAFT_868817 [Mycena belliae]